MDFIQKKLGPYKEHISTLEQGKGKVKVSRL